MKAHCNQNEKVKDQDTVLNAARKKWSVIYKVIPLRLSTALSIYFADQRYCHNLFKMTKSGGVGKKKKKKKKQTYKKEYSIQQGYHSHLKERKNLHTSKSFELSTNKPVF